IAETVVAFDNRVAEPRGPKAVCEPIPPNAPARSAALPLCSSTTTIKNKQTSTWMVTSRIIIFLLSVYQLPCCAKIPQHEKGIHFSRSPDAYTLCRPRRNAGAPEFHSHRRHRR